MIFAIPLAEFESSRASLHVDSVVVVAMGQNSLFFVDLEASERTIRSQSRENNSTVSDLLLKILSPTDVFFARSVVQTRIGWIMVD